MTHRFPDRYLWNVRTHVLLEELARIPFRSKRSPYQSIRNRLLQENLIQNGIEVLLNVQFAVQRSCLKLNILVPLSLDPLIEDRD